MRTRRTYESLEVFREALANEHAAAIKRHGINRDHRKYAARDQDGYGIGVGGTICPHCCNHDLDHPTIRCDLQQALKAELGPNAHVCRICRDPFTEDGDLCPWCEQTYAPDPNLRTLDHPRPGNARYQHMRITHPAAFTPAAEVPRDEVCHPISADGVEE